MRRENQTPQRVPKNTYSPVDFRQGSDRRARYEKDPCMHQVECIAGWPPSPPPREVRRNDNAVSDWLPRAARRLAARARAEASCLIQPKFKPVDRQV